MSDLLVITLILVVQVGGIASVERKTVFNQREYASVFSYLHAVMQFTNSLIH